jgi:hypothetical protein
MYLCLYLFVNYLYSFFVIFSSNLNTKSGSDSSGSEAEDATNVGDIFNPTHKKWLPISSWKPIPKMESEENPIAVTQEYATLAEPTSNEDTIMREEAKRNIENAPPRITDMMVPVVFRQSGPTKLPSVFTRWAGAFGFTMILFFYSII